MYVLVQHLPLESSTRTATGGHGWTLTDYLLADLFNLWATEGEHHPADPRYADKADKNRRPDAEAIRAARARHRARRQRLGITGSVLRPVPDPPEP